VKHPNLRRMTFAASAALILGGLGSVPLTAAASPPAGGHTLAPSTRFFVPSPAQGSLQQVAQLVKGRDLKDANLLLDMEATPQAVWLDGETAAEDAEGAAGAQQADFQVGQQVRQALFEAGLENAVPILVAYNIPGRDCSEYSAGGAPSDTAYDQWISAFAQALGWGKAVVILEPDALANLPTDCSAAYQTANPGITDATREADVADAVNALEADPNVSVYLDGGHSAWQNVGNIAQPLVAAGVAKAQGFFLDVSNYQFAQNNVQYGTWVSDCIAMGAGSLTYDYSDNCPNQYWNGGPSGTEIATLLGAWTGVALSPYGVWSDASTTADLNTSGINARYAGVDGTTHFVIDTSRNGLGPNDMATYGVAPYDQSAATVGTLAAGNWCNPPGAGTGILPTANTSGVSPLLDAYLWVKTPGQSDGQCDAAGGVRAWDYTAYTQPGWPTSSSAQALFDPLWGQDDPAAGAWFAPQALQLARNANPPLTFPIP